MWFDRRCKVCERLKEENSYLKKLVDSLLQNKGVAPVISEAETVLAESEDEKADRALAEKGAQRYGD